MSILFPIGNCRDIYLWSYNAFAVNKLSFILSLIAVTGLAHADVKSEINAANQRVEKCAMVKDIKGAESAMKEALTPDFKYHQSGKTQDRKTYIGNFVASIKMMDKISTHSTVFKGIKERGNRATGQIEKKMMGSMISPDKKTHGINWTGQFTEEYRKVGGKWKTCEVTAGKQIFLLDGKLVKM